MPQVAIGKVFTQLAIGLVLSGVSYVLRPKQKRIGSNRSRQLTARSTVDSYQCIYGETRVGGTIAFQHQVNSDTHIIAVLAGHPCEAVTKLWFGDEEVTLDGSGNATGKYAGLVSMQTRLGAIPETHYNDLLLDIGSSLWTSDHRGDGLTHVWLKLTYDQDRLRQLPELSFTVQGKNDIHDPRTDTTGYTSNAALCTADYLKWQFGLRAEDDEVNEAALIEAANICDEDVDLDPGGTQKRYSCNGAFYLDQSHEQIINDLLTSMGGSQACMTYTEGQFHIYPAVYRAPVVTLTEDDLAGSLSLKTLTSRRELANTVKGVFLDAQQNHVATDYPLVVDSAALTQDGEQIPRELDLPFTDSHAACQRIGRIELNAVRKQRELRGSFKLGAYQLRPPFVCYVDLPGLEGVPFEVHDAYLENSESPNLSLLLRETGSDVFDWDESTQELSMNEPPTPATADDPPHQSGQGVGQQNVAPLGDLNLRTFTDGTPDTRILWDATDYQVGDRVISVPAGNEIVTADTQYWLYFDDLQALPILTTDPDEITGASRFFIQTIVSDDGATGSDPGSGSGGSGPGGSDWPPGV